MLARYRKAAAVGLIAAVTALASWAVADGIYQTYPGVGQPSFCASTVTGIVLPTGQGPYGVVPGSTQGTSIGVCAQTVPAGPPTFAGTEHAAFDMNALGVASNGAAPATATVSVLQLGQGALLALTTVTTTVIPNYTPWVYLNGAQSANFTLTMPPNPIDGQVQNIVCVHTTSGDLFVAANAGQSINGGGNLSTCAAFGAFYWRYSGANTTWYRY